MHRLLHLADSPVSPPSATPAELQDCVFILFMCFLCFSRASVGKPQEQRDATGRDEDQGIHISVSIVPVKFFFSQNSSSN